MSLINDALRQAKETQQKNPPTPPAGPPLRPVEAATRRDAAPRYLRAAALLGMVLAVVMAALLVRQSSRKPVSPQQIPAAVQASPAQPGATPDHVPSSEAPETKPLASSPESVNAQKSLPANGAVAAAPAPAPEPFEPRAQTQAPGNATPVAAEPAPTVAASNAPSAPAEPPPPPKPEPLKLQGILYRPANPLAIVNGKTVGVGDPVAEGWVVTITQTSVTVVTAGQTNILSLAR